MGLDCTRRWLLGFAAFFGSVVGCRDSTIVFEAPNRSSRPQQPPVQPQGRRERHPATEAPPIPEVAPDIPVVAEPCTPEAELLAFFDEYQTAFEDADGSRILSLHTTEEQERQVLACLAIMRDRSRQHPSLSDVLHACGATKDLLEIAVAHNSEDPIESSVAVKTVVPRLRDTPRLVSATLESLAADGPVRPKLFNLNVTGDRATATLVLQYPERGQHSDRGQRSRLEFTRASGQWLIAAERSAPAANPPAIYRPDPMKDPMP